jgi:hypothetical protein
LRTDAAAKAAIRSNSNVDISTLTAPPVQAWPRQHTIKPFTWRTAKKLAA